LKVTFDQLLSSSAFNFNLRPYTVGGMATLPRVCTFGIGRYCNHYFLKMLANIGRGMSDAAFTPARIQEQMSGRTWRIMLATS